MANKAEKEDSLEKKVLKKNVIHQADKTLCRLKMEPCLNTGKMSVMAQARLSEERKTCRKDHSFPFKAFIASRQHSDLMMWDVGYTENKGTISEKEFSKAI